MELERNPLIVRGVIVAAAVAALHLAIILGWLDLTAEAEGQAALVIDLIGTAVLVVWTRGTVTPTADPRNDEGVPLVPDPYVIDSPAYRGRHASGPGAVLGVPEPDEEGEA